MKDLCELIEAKARAISRLSGFHSETPEISDTYEKIQNDELAHLQNLVVLLTKEILDPLDGAYEKEVMPNDLEA